MRAFVLLLVVAGLLCPVFSYGERVGETCVDSFTDTYHPSYLDGSMLPGFSYEPVCFFIEHVHKNTGLAMEVYFPFNDYNRAIEVGIIDSSAACFLSGHLIGCYMTGY